MLGSGLSSFSFNSFSAPSLFVLALLFFLTSVVGVVTGSNSLITVPVMYQFDIDPRVAVATNMFGLTFMSVGGALPFIGSRTIDRRRLPALVALTLVGSVLGALLVLVISSRAMPLFISVSMLVVTVLTLSLRRQRAEGKRGERASAAEGMEAGGRSHASEWAGYGAAFALGIYGGFFSGGYVTLLTAAFVAFFRMTFVEAVATTKVVNVFSSAVATLVFMANGLVDYRLGAIIAVVMFAGAFVGARVALRLDELWLRRVFLTTVIALALKILLYDFLWKGLAKG
jgi:uncharacterized membrane protein YfcA